MPPRMSMSRSQQPDAVPTSGAVVRGRQRLGPLMLPLTSPFALLLARVITGDDALNLLRLDFDLVDDLANVAFPETSARETVWAARNAPVAIASRTFRAEAGSGRVNGGKCGSLFASGDHAE
jgi:hypothetical protein